MRPIWTGTIGFGLVNIPVKLYSATESSTLDLDMLDKKDHSNIRFKRVNTETGKEVAWGNIVKGYKLPNDEYVVLNDSDFENASAVKTKNIAIAEFVGLDEIDTLYYEKPFYIEPAKSGERAYALLHQALLKSGKAGVSTFVMRQKESLAIVKAGKKVLILNRIRFEEEIRDTGDLKIPSSRNVKAGELKMALSLINQLTGKFNISKYKDTYSGELMKIIKTKAKGRKPKVSKLKVVHGATKDLMGQLKASLDGKKKKAS